MGNKRRKDKQRRSKVHAEQMHILELSCDPNIVPLSLRIQLLHKLHPKYLIRAIDETLELQLVSGNDQVLLEVKKGLASNQLSVKQAMAIFTLEGTYNG